MVHHSLCPSLHNHLPWGKSAMVQRGMHHSYSDWGKPSIKSWNPLPLSVSHPLVGFSTSGKQFFLPPLMSLGPMCVVRTMKNKLKIDLNWRKKFRTFYDNSFMVASRQTHLRQKIVSSHFKYHIPKQLFLGGKKIYIMSVDRKKNQGFTGCSTKCAEDIGVQWTDIYGWTPPEICCISIWLVNTHSLKESRPWYQCCFKTFANRYISKWL